MSHKIFVYSRIFKTIKDASSTLGIDKKTIKNYLEDESNLSCQYVQKVFVLGRFYKNISVASDELGIGRTTLSNRLKSDNFLGYWLYGHGELTQHLNVQSEFVLPSIEEMIYVEGRVFKSLYEASIELGLNRNSIRYRVQSENPKWSKWCYCSNKIGVYSAMLDNPYRSDSDGKDVCGSKCKDACCSNVKDACCSKCVPPLGGSETKNIRCMVEGEVYDSVKEASEQTSIKYRTLLSRLHSDSPKFQDYIILNNSRQLFIEDNLSARHGGNEYSYDEDFETDDFFDDMLMARGIDLDDY